MLVHLDVRVYVYIDESQDKHQRSRRMTDALSGNTDGTERKVRWILMRAQRGEIRRKAEVKGERRCQKKGCSRGMESKSKSLDGGRRNQRYYNNRRVTNQIISEPFSSCSDGEGR